MKKKIAVGAIIFILLVLTISAFFAFPKIKESNIKSEIEKANYCDVKEDCIDAGGKCPFNCYAYVNKDEVSRISKLIKSFDSKCIYSCVYCPDVECKNNKCEAVCE